VTDDAVTPAATTAEQARQATGAVTDLFREHHLELVRVGKVLYVATTQAPAGHPDIVFCYPVSLGPSQLNALIGCIDSFGRLDGSHFTPLPGGSMTPLPGSQAAW
jgi:hypothetical protein